jgi:hypothetical protein
VWQCVVDWTCVAQDKDRLAGSCEHGNEPVGYRNLENPNTVRTVGIGSEFEPNSFQMQIRFVSSVVFLPYYRVYAFLSRQNSKEVLDKRPLDRSCTSLAGFINQKLDLRYLFVDIDTTPSPVIYLVMAFATFSLLCPRTCVQLIHQSFYLSFSLPTYNSWSRPFISLIVA